MPRHQRPVNRIGFRSTIPENQYLSNFSESKINVTTVTDKLLWKTLSFCSNEQRYQHAKCIVGGNIDLAERILATTNPVECKGMAKDAFKVKDSKGRIIFEIRRKNVWESISSEIMVCMVFDKFAQNPNLMTQLEATEKKELVEINRGKWGGEISLDQLMSGVPTKGENVLGEAIMMIRSYRRGHFIDMPKKIFIGDSMVARVNLPGYRKICIPGANLQILGTIATCFAKPWVTDICFFGGTNDCPIAGKFDPPQLNADETPKAHLPHRVLRKLQMFVKILLENAPNAKISVCEILPRHCDAKTDASGTQSQMQKTVQGFNDRLKSLPSKLGERVKVVSYTGRFEDRNLFSSTGEKPYFHLNNHVRVVTSRRTHGTTVKIEDGRSTYQSLIKQLEEITCHPASDPLNTFMEIEFEGDVVEFVRKLKKLAKRFLSTQVAIDELVLQRLLEKVSIAQREFYKQKSLGDLVREFEKINCEDIFVKPTVMAVRKETCKKCNKMGHAAESCWSDKVCEKCGRKGHIKRVCCSKSPKNEFRQCRSRDGLMVFPFL